MVLPPLEKEEKTVIVTTTVDSKSAKDGYEDAVRAFMREKSMTPLIDHWLSLPESDYKKGWRKLLSNEGGCLGKLMVVKLVESEEWSVSK